MSDGDRFRGRGRFSGPPAAGPNANVTVALKPLSQRDVTADQVIARLRPKLAQRHGREHVSCNRFRTCGPAAGRPTPNTNGACSGDDLTELRAWSVKLRQAMQDMPEITDVDSDMPARRTRSRPHRRPRHRLAIGLE